VVFFFSAVVFSILSLVVLISFLASFGIFLGANSNNLSLSFDTLDTLLDSEFSVSNLIGLEISVFTEFLFKFIKSLLLVLVTLYVRSFSSIFSILALPKNCFYNSSC